MKEVIPKTETTFWSQGRSKSYEYWPFKSPKLKCNPEQMAAAGFVYIGSESEPDLVECFICSKQLDGWDANDDPWQEHRKHQSNCPFILLNKQNEMEWTLEELYSMMKHYYAKELVRAKEMIINSLKKEMAEMRDQIPIIYKNSLKNRKNYKEK